MIINNPGEYSKDGLVTLNAVTAQDNRDCYKVAYETNASRLQIKVDLLKAAFDFSSVNIPCFMVVGTSKVDAGDGKISLYVHLLSLWKSIIIIPTAF